MTRITRIKARRAMRRAGPLASWLTIGLCVVAAVSLFAQAFKNFGSYFE